MALTAQDFAFVSDLVRRESAIVLAPGKEYLVEARLLPLARKAGVAPVSEFVSGAKQRPERPGQWSIVEALTTNETSWFRDHEPFAMFTDLVLPQLRAARSATRTLRVWSAACSSGQEPYTIAMVLADVLPAGWIHEIMATDLSTQMIARASAGRFSQLEMNRGLPAAMLVRHFERVGHNWQVCRSLRNNISFRSIHLATPLPALPPFDVIFLRNVLIYFDLETKRSVLRRIRSLLAPDGWLFLGSAETTIGVDGDFERAVAGKTSAYRLRATQTAAAGALGKR